MALGLFEGASVHLAEVDSEFVPTVSRNYSSESDWYPSVETLILQSDGKILVGGRFNTLNGIQRQCIGRLHPNGSLDPTFFSGPSFSGTVPLVRVLAVEPNGKVLVGGDFTFFSGYPRKNIARLNADGTLDSGFNPGANGGVYSIALQTDGMILVGGWFTSLAGQERSNIGRLNTDGTIDGDFNPGANTGVTSLTLQPDGKILVGGWFTSLAGQTRSNIGRLHIDGSLDGAFDPRPSGTVFALALQPDGKILIGGSFMSLAGQTRSNLGRLNIDGSLENGFDTAANNSVSTLVVQPDGKILVGGSFTTLARYPRSHIGRLLSDGCVDNGFDPGANGSVRSLAAQPDGEVLVGGHFTRLGGQSRMFIGRINNTTPNSIACQQTNLIGETVSLCATFGGVPQPALQWRVDGRKLDGQTNPCLALPRADTNHSGGYSIVASNASGCATSAVVMLTIRGQAPIFKKEPENQTVIEGTDVSLVAAAMAAPPASYTLLFEGKPRAVPFMPFSAKVPWDGFTLTEITTNDAGSYAIVATNSFGVVTSRVAQVNVVPAGPLDRWNQRNPLPQSKRILSVTRGKDLFVAVGEHGAVLTSQSGAVWTMQPRSVDLALRDVTYGAGMFVAVGELGIILASEDGTNWAHCFSSRNAVLTSVEYGNGMFVAMGRDNDGLLAITFSNGVTWDRKILSNGPQKSPALAFGNGTFVAVSSALSTSTNGSTLSTSTNGVDWVHREIPMLASVGVIAFLNDQFIAFGPNGGVAVSPDAINWTHGNVGTDERVTDVSYGNGQYVAVGNDHGVIFTSSDALTWRKQNSGTPDRLEAVVFGEGKFVAAGENGTIISSFHSNEWTKNNLGTTLNLDGLLVSSGLIVVVGKWGTILTSLDGISYTQQKSGTTNELHGVARSEGLFVVVGRNGTVLHSSNAVDWTSQDSVTTNNLKGVLHASGQWIAVGTKGTVLTSMDGMRWDTRFIEGSYDLNDIAYGHGRFVVVGDGWDGKNGSLFTSTDGQAWSPFVGSHSEPWTPPPANNLRGIKFANGLFVIAGNDSVLMVSSNGLDWVSHPLGVGANLRSVTRANEYWVAVGNEGTIFTSTDMRTWTERSSRSLENLHGVAGFQCGFVIIGNRGTILQSVSGVSCPTPNIAPLIQTPSYGTEFNTHVGGKLRFSCKAVDWDLPEQMLTYTLFAGPAGATLDRLSGEFTWQPTLRDADSTNTIKIVVTDDGSPFQSATNGITVVVKTIPAANFGPLLAEVAYRLESGNLSVPQRNALVHASAVLDRTTGKLSPDLRLLRRINNILAAVLSEDSSLLTASQMTFGSFLPEAQLAWDEITTVLGLFTSGIPPGLSNSVGRAQQAYYAAVDADKSLAERCRALTVVLNRIRVANIRAARLIKAPENVAGKAIVYVKIASGDSGRAKLEPEYYNQVGPGGWTYQRTGATTARITVEGETSSTIELGLIFLNRSTGVLYNPLNSEIEGSFEIIAR